MVSLKFYGGVNEIGGNKILLEDRDTKIFLDFGVSFEKRGRYFEEYLKPRVSNGILDFFEFDLLPKIKGIYRLDLLRMAGMEVHKELFVDGVLLSHSHLDHSGYISFLDEGIPVYSSEITKLILKSVQETSPRSIETEIYNYKKRPISKKEELISRVFRTFKGKFRINSLEVEEFPVDHSVPGAQAFLIYTSEGAVVYTGDLRLHGPFSSFTKKFIEKAKEAEPEIMISEGTRIDENEKNTEEDVLKKSMEVVRKTKELVIADFALKDIYRFNTFYKIAKRCDRKLCILTKDAYILNELRNEGIDVPKIEDENILIYIKKRNTGLYRKADYNKWELKFLEYENAVKADYVHKHQNKIIICLSFWDLNELIDIKPNIGSAYIHSASEAHNEEQEMDEWRLDNWLTHFKLPKYHYHSSGHANREDIIEVVREIKPKKLYPVHTKRTELFKNLKNFGIDVTIPEL